MFGLNKYLYVGLAFFVIALSYFAYYQTTQLHITKLKAELQTTAAALEEAALSIKVLTSQKQLQDRLNKQLESELADTEEYALKLKTLLAEHNLTYLAKEKPGLIEKRINDATEKVFTDLKQLTGSQ